MGRPLQLLLITSLIGFSSASVFSWLECQMSECCDDPYIKPNFTGMAQAFDERLFGQHIVQSTVIPALQAHFEKSKNSKPLVLSFNGMTGTGKNHVARIIAEHIYSLGLNSRFVKLFFGLTNYDPSKIHLYKEELQKILMNKVGSCGRAMFIFDEVDKLPEQLLDSLKPFLEYTENVYGLDFRNAIFIFLSNHGGDAISQVAVNARASGKARNQLRVSDFEKIVTEHIYYSKGGLEKSQLISNQLIDHFVPFLPLERQHAKKCIIAYLNTRDVVAARDESFMEEILLELLYFPASDPIFSKSGCKRLEQKSDVALTEWRARRFQISGKAGDKDHDEM